MQDAIKINNKEHKKIVNHTQLGSSHIDYTLVGESFQAVMVQLDHGESVFARSGSISWMTPNAKITEAKNFDRIGLINIECPYSVSVICLAPVQAGKITAAIVDTETTISIRRSKFLCAESGVKLIETKKYGHHRFWLVGGTGIAHFTSLAESIVYQLSDEDELLVDEENLVAYDNKVTCTLERVGGSLRQIIYAGEGFNLIRVKGPGKVWLQTVKPQEIK